MEKIKGIIGHIEHTNGVKKNTDESWNKWAFTISGGIYSTFTDIIGEGFKIGDAVDVSIERKGNFLNITDMKLITDESEKANIEKDKEYIKYAVKSPTSLAQDRSNTIIAQCMVKSAGYALSGRSEFTIDDVVKTTVQFTKAYRASIIELERTQD